MQSQLIKGGILLNMDEKRVAKTDKNRLNTKSQEDKEYEKALVKELERLLSYNQ